MKQITTIKSMYSIKSIFALVMAAIVAVTFVACGGGSSTASNESDASTETETATNEETNSAGGMVFTEEAIKELKDKFIFDEEAGYYYHKHWNKSWPKRRTLTADVNKTGYYYLCSNFYGNKGIKHSQVMVKFGEEKISTEKMDLKNETDHRVENTGDGNVFEVNYYTNYRDNKIFETIGKSESGKDILVRFVGATSYTEEALPQSDYEALKDCYNLSLLLRYEAAQGAQ